ncbi:MAG: lysyl oxidase family protein [Actinomycetota bacterium]|nr:lysyl oxidase family protein [Actinomycetota bacterium]
MTALLVSASLALAGLGVIASAVPRAASATGTGRAALLPDVVLRPMTEIRIQKSKGVKLLRFASIIGNSGAGVVELKPDSPTRSAANDCDGDGDPLNDRQAFQRIFGDSDGDGVFTRGVDTVLTKRFAGCSLFHVEHDHWHFEEFARYRLVKPKSGRVVASSEKVSFCVRDSLRFDPTLPGSPFPQYYGSCTQDSITGLSIGWADYYGSNLPGQELDVRGLPDGRYCLRTEADPADRIDESDEGNNGRSTLVRIRGRRVRDLGRAC